MRYLIVLSMAALMVLSGCYVGVRGHGHYRFRSHGHYHHRHHGHHHWNAAGPAYAEASKIEMLSILPASLPDDIEGNYSPDDKRTWPTRAAQLVADSLTESTDSKVTGTVSETRPATGYYMTLDITYLDMGDISPNADGTPRERGSGMSAHGVIVNANSGQVVADVKFSHSSGWTGTSMFDPFMMQIGSSLGDWFKERRGEK